MATIKQFKGTTPPVLKKGELATDGNYIYLCLEDGKVEKFVHEQRVLTMIQVNFASHIQQYH